ncbi:hypothetical protein SNOG_00372 [Parastagonospora nodorum SN15]|uniref:Uncharacterized protein n=1 Tax=Phaeosphaeria nodorum (strain SN15 / ATCC MYA-4574 / FGSC 10173) TaxID=321614 RepID=Q0V6J2_PHANO|nr:hypothetical protein SNOG_00372 [Parastagonospora nodorum SN15]EAT91867.1 hypothetical protein SNOG_00372 [Parastagonospora nodorum SN15]
MPSRCDDSMLHAILYGFDEVKACVPFLAHTRQAVDSLVDTRSMVVGIFPILCSPYNIAVTQYHLDLFNNAIKKSFFPPGALPASTRESTSNSNPRELHFNQGHKA